MEDSVVAFFERFDADVEQRAAEERRAARAYFEHLQAGGDPENVPKDTRIFTSVYRLTHKQDGTVTGVISMPGSRVNVKLDSVVQARGRETLDVSVNHHDVLPVVATA